MKLPQSPVVALPLALMLASGPANGHDGRFSDEPGSYFLELGLVTREARNGVAISMGGEVCWLTHVEGHALSYKPCLSLEGILTEEAKAILTADLLKFELDFKESDGLFLEWGGGVAFQGGFTGYQGSIALGWRTQSKIENIGAYVSVGPYRMGLLNPQPLSDISLKADAQASLNWWNGSSADGEFNGLNWGVTGVSNSGWELRLGYLF